MQINQLSAVDTVSAGDLLALWATSNGDTRKCSLTVLAAFLQTLITANDDKITQYAAPSATAFNVQINNDNLSVWLILTPNAGYATGTITLPALANCIDKQEILVNTTQAVVALTIGANGSNLAGMPTALVAGGFFRLRFDGVLDTWYRVG